MSLTCTISAASCTSSSVARKAAIKSGRQIAQKSYRVRKQRAAARRQAHGAHRGIERGEHFRGGKHVGMSERVEQRGFSGVGVTHQRDHAQRHGLARAAARGALAAHGFDGFFYFADAVADAPAVGFQFLFARSARADAAAQPRKFFAAPGKPRQQIIQLRQLHLQLAFARARVHGENIQNQLRAVNHAACRCPSPYCAAARESRLWSTITSGTWRSSASARISSSLPRPTSVAGSSASRTCRMLPAIFAPARFGQLVQFFQRIAARSRRIARTSARRFFQAHADEQHAFAIVHGLRGFHADRVALTACKVREILFIGNPIIRRMGERREWRSVRAEQEGS